MELSISFATPLRIIETHAQPELVAVFTFQVGNFIFKGASMPGSAVSAKASGTMQSGTLATASVEWHDSGGNPVKVDGPTKWVSTDPSIVACTVATGNSNIANLSSPGPVGTAQIQATADADMGTGVRTVTSTIDITVISGEAVAGTITFTPGSSTPTPPSPGGPGKR